MSTSRAPISASSASVASRPSTYARDLPDALRSDVLDKMRSSGAPERWITMVSQVVEMDAEDQQRSLGDSLPPGLVLL